MTGIFGHFRSSFPAGLVTLGYEYAPGSSPADMSGSERLFAIASQNYSTVEVGGLYDASSTVQNVNLMNAFERGYAESYLTLDSFEYTANLMTISLGAAFKRTDFDLWVQIPSG